MKTITLKFSTERFDGMNFTDEEVHSLIETEIAEDNFEIKEGFEFSSMVIDVVTEE